MCTRQNLVVSLVLAISMVGVGYGAGGVLPGDGSSESTAYRIEDLADFDVFADPCNSATYWSSGVYTKLTCDPNLTGRSYTTAVIAPDTPGTNWPFDGIPFEGVFDGNGYVIRNLTVDTAGADNDYLGLFGKIEGFGAQVKNLGVENINITGGTDSRWLGGLCGYNDYGTITNCYATGSVAGGNTSSSLGGLCGKNDSGTIINCYTTGLVTGGPGSCYLGGLCGCNGDLGSSGGTITNCYAASSVIGGDYSGHLGGLCGENDGGTISNCYFYLLSGPENGWGTALDDLQMQEAGSFVGFDFAGNPNDGEDDYWTIVTGHCPKLSWQTDDGPLVPTPPVTTLSGSGYSYDPFQINSYADFTEFRTNSDLRYGYYILTTDIDLSGDTFTTAVIDGFFGGYFDGNDHIIRNITIDTAGADNDHLGLFGKIYYASVSDLGIENINITGGTDSRYLGGLCGKNNSGTITNCYATGSVTGDDRLGGLCGFNSYGTITNCYAAGSVTGDAYLGGLCGFNAGTITNCYAAGLVTGDAYPGGLCGENYGTITNCYAAGSVTGEYSFGGLCGHNKGTITNCYATGSVTGGDNSYSLGGLCGRNYNGTITNCYATGSVTGGDSSEYLGGLCGYNWDGTITNCFWDVETSGIGIEGDDNYGATGKTTEQMQTESTFTDANWDFDVVPLWHMPFETTGYPMLGWQKDIPVDFTGRYGVDMDDFAVLAETWGLSLGQAGYNELCDLIDDDTIDLDDLAVFVENWLAGK